VGGFAGKLAVLWPLSKPAAPLSKKQMSSWHKMQQLGDKGKECVVCEVWRNGDAGKKRTYVMKQFKQNKSSNAVVCEAD